MPKDMFNLKIIINLCFFLLTTPLQICANEDATTRDNVTNSDEGMHGEPWAFGRSPDREEPIWVKGRTGKSLLSKKKQAAGQQGTENNENQDAKGRIKSSLGLSVKEESGTWKVTPYQKNVRPDENRVRENKHILGAYAGLEAGDDFNIKVGPELIIRDETHGDESAYSEQPDSAFGLGMKFKYDF